MPEESLEFISNRPRPVYEVQLFAVVGGHHGGWRNGYARTAEQLQRRPDKRKRSSGTCNERHSNEVVDAKQRAVVALIPDK